MQNLVIIAIIVMLIGCLLVFGFTTGDITGTGSFVRKGKIVHYVKFETTSLFYKGKRTYYAKCEANQKTSGIITRWNCYSDLDDAKRYGF